MCHPEEQRDEGSTLRLSWAGHEARNADPSLSLGMTMAISHGDTSRGRSLFSPAATSSRSQQKLCYSGFWLTTMAGVELAVAPAVVAPFPSCPASFRPQHQTVSRLMLIAQLCEPLPVPIPLAAASIASIDPARTGVEPFATFAPSWPDPFRPHQYTAFAVATPHE